MSTDAPRIAIPVPTSFDPEYNGRSWPAYARAVEASGGVAVQVELDKPQSEVAKLLSSCSAVLLPGSGADLNPQKYGETAEPECNRSDPAREAVDELLLQDAFNLRKPILGICYGIQALNVWRNGSLCQHLTTTVNHKPGREIREAHEVVIAAGSRLADLATEAGEPGELHVLVNSSHHQSIAAAGDGLRVVARSPQDEVIEAVELPGGTGAEQFVLGVQWHPERTFDNNELSRSIFTAFVRAAGEWTPRPIEESVVQPRADSSIRL